MTIPRIVLTGGPCAGKTSALARIRARLQTYGRHVYTTSEASTIMLDGGARIAGAPPARQLLYQRGVLRVTMAIEDALLAFARSMPEDSVLICDRGAMDGKAYITGDLWDGLLVELNYETAELRDRRYDAIIHLVTAADGAEQFFGNENNPGRYEDLDGARAVDRRLREAWAGHARHAIIDNSTDFDEKMRRVVAVVCGHVGVPGPGRWERKYLVRPAADLPLCQVLDIEQTYLKNPDGTEARVRKCSVGGVCSYTHTRKKDIGEGRRIEIERPITLREYNDHLMDADPERQPIRKRRCVYPHAGLYFQLDHFQTPRTDLWLMEVEVDDLTRPVPMPPFVEVEREVTGDVDYHNANLAQESEGDMEADYPAAHSMDTLWFAVDAEGYVAAFYTGEGGHFPSQISEIDGFDTLGTLEATFGIPEDEDEDFATRARAIGVFGYRYSYDDAGPLVLQYLGDEVPDAPLHIDQLPPDLRESLREVAFSALTFSATDSIQPMEFFPCESWIENPCAYLCADGKTVRPISGREGSFAQFVEDFRAEDPKRAAELIFDGPSGSAKPEQKKRGKKRGKGEHGT